jgi:biopolymer transport protein ExbD
MKVPQSSQRRGGGAMEINMTPMIDMVFLLIVYFVWTSGDLAQEMLLPSRISEQAGTAAEANTETPPPEADFDPVVVRIAWQNDSPQWRVNDQPLASLGELREILANLAEIKRDAPVILHPDPQVPLGTVIDVYDLSRVIGFEKVQFATSGRP